LISSVYAIAAKPDISRSSAVAVSHYDRTGSSLAKVGDMLGEAFGRNSPGA